MIEFKVVRWKNLLSTGNSFNEIDLSLSGSTLIVGKNGFGKSSCLDALLFSLYGKPFRKINKGQLVNSINKKELVAEVEFNVGSSKYLVRRGMKPTIFEIYQDGEKLENNGISADTQENFEKYILKMNYRTFSQVVVLGAASFVPFMELTASHRREVIEDILDIGIFSVMSQLMKNRNDELVRKIRELDYERQSKADAVSIREKFEEAAVIDNLQRLQFIDNKISKLAENGQSLVKEKSELSIELIKLKELVDAEDKLRTEYSDFSKEIVRIDNSIMKIKKSKNTNCSECQQPVTAEHFTLHLDKALEEKSVVITKLEAISAKMFADNKQLQQEKNRRFASISTEIDIIKKSIKELTVEKSKVTVMKAPDGDNVEEAKVKLSIVDGVRNKAYSDKEVYSYVSSLLKDSGVKTALIKEYIPIMNKHINSNLAALDFFVEFELDEEFNETIRSRLRDDFSYSSFSEGEKARINLAILFAWRAIAKLRNSASTNLVIMDEVFDSSLDAAGGDDFMKMLTVLIKDTNAFVISHKESTTDKFDRIIKFEKVKNFSVIVEA